MYVINSEDVLSGEVFSCVLGDKKFDTEEEAIQYATEDILENYAEDLEDLEITEADIKKSFKDCGSFEFENWSGNTYKYELEEE